MKANLSFAKIWKQLGTVASLNQSGNLSAETSSFEMLATLFLDAGLISDYNLRRMRLLVQDDENTSLALLLLLFEVYMNQGHTRFTLPKDPDKFADKLKTLFEDIEEISAAEALIVLPEIKSILPDWEQKFTAAFVSGLYDTKFQESIRFEKYPLRLQKDDAGFHLYSDVLLFHEQTICSKMEYRLTEPSESVDATELKKILREVLVQDCAFPLNYRQQIAVALSCLCKTAFITGGPGTGKTSVVVQILRALIRLQPKTTKDIVMCAPTGRAAARLQESVSTNLGSIQYLAEVYKPDAQLANIQGTTIHKLLGYNPGTAKFFYNETHKLPAKIVIVDEFSMLDIRLFSCLLQALSNDCRLLLLGDRNQLPSVDTGAVLGDFSDIFYQGEFRSLSESLESDLAKLLPEESIKNESLISETNHILRDHLVILTESHRSEKSILELATAINSEDESLTRETLTAYPKLNEKSDFMWPVPVENEEGKKQCKPSGVRLLNLQQTDEPRQKDQEFLYIIKQWIQAHFTGSKNVFTKNQLNTCKAAIREFLTEYPTGADDESGQKDARKIGPQHSAYNALDRLQEALDESRILCVNKAGPRGVYRINKEAADICFAAFQLSEEERRRFDKYNQKIESKVSFTGMPVIINRNSPENHLSNGDVGFLLQTGFGMAFCIKRLTEFELIPLQKIPEWQAAFAMTIHKSQGSEFEHVLLVLPEKANRLMTREILYTGVTRAKYFCGVLGDPELFAVSVQRSVQRDSGIPGYLEGIVASS